MAVRWRKLCTRDLKKEKYCNYINLKMKIVCDIIKIDIKNWLFFQQMFNVYDSSHLSCLCPKLGGCTILFVCLVFCTFIMFMSQGVGGGGVLVSISKRSLQSSWECKSVHFETLNTGLTFCHIGEIFFNSNNPSVSDTDISCLLSSVI